MTDEVLEKLEAIQRQLEELSDALMMAPHLVDLSRIEARLDGIESRLDGWDASA